MRVVVVGAGIGGLTLALELADAGIDCRVVEAVPDVSPIGVGINVMPHASAVLARHDVIGELSRRGVETAESVFFNRFGQLVHREPSGRRAGYEQPQLSVHRGDLQMVLLAAVQDRLGQDAIMFGQRCVGVEQDDRSAAVLLRSTADDAGLPSVSADLVIGCDGIHSVVRRQFHPHEEAPRYSGVNMWRGATVHPPFLSGASMVRAGWLATGKMVIYPIRDRVNEAGDQLINWVAEIETPRRLERDWNRPGDLADFVDAFDDWRFDWLDVPALIRQTDTVLEYPMVDQDPLDRWTFGRVSLLGDAAHPMVPRGSNGAGQAIVDARALREALVQVGDGPAALRAYEATRLPATSRVVLTNRQNPPDAILREVWERTGDRPFGEISEVISPEEISQITDRYRAVAGMAAPTGEGA